MVLKFTTLWPSYCPPNPAHWRLSRCNCVCIQIDVGSNVAVFVAAEYVSVPIPVPSDALISVKIVRDVTLTDVLECSREIARNRNARFSIVRVCGNGRARCVGADCSNILNVVQVAASSSASSERTSTSQRPRLSVLRQVKSRFPSWRYTA